MSYKSENWKEKLEEVRNHIALKEGSVEKTADEILDESELMTLKSTLQKDFQINEDEIDELIDLAKENVEDSTSLYEFTRDINDNFDAAERVKLIESMWKIAYADGNIDKFEEHIIRKVSNLIYVSHSDFIKAKISAKEKT